MTRTQFIDCAGNRMAATFGLPYSGGLTFWDNGATTGFTSNNNLFFTPTYSSKPGDRSLTWCCWPSMSKTTWVS